MKKRDVGDHEDKCSKEHIRLLLKKVDDLNAQLQRQPSESCKFMWRIESWSKTLENAKMEATDLFSSAFYTGYPGYKLCMCVNPDYQGKGHVGVYLIIMKGDFDHQLQWPFPYSYRLTVVDQQPDGNNVSVLIDSTKLNRQELKWFMRKTVAPINAIELLLEMDDPVEFLDSLPKDLECPICLLHFKEPLLTSCGHRYCKSCVDKITRSDNN